MPKSDSSFCSKRQLQFLKQQNRTLCLIRLIRILLFLLFLGVWEISSRFGFIDSFIFSSPSKVFLTAREMFLDKTLLLHTSITLFETLVSFLLVCIISFTFALSLWCFLKFSAILEPYLVILNSLPKSALAPLLIVWLGSNQKTIIVAGISVAIFGAVLNLYTGFCQTDKDKLKLIQTLKGSKADALFHVVIPASIPLSFSIMKVNIGLCLIGVIIGEMIGSKEGLGYLIIYSSQAFKLDTMIMSICILCIIAASFYGLLCLAEKKYLKH